MAQLYSKRLLIASLLFATVLLAQNRSTPLVILPNAADTQTGELQLREKRANGANYAGFKAPDALAGNRIWVLPAADGTSGQCLKTNAAGVLSFGDCVTGGGSVIVQLDGGAVGTENTLNFVTGSGIIWTLTNPSGKINVQADLDTAVALTKAAHQSGAALYATTGGSSTIYTAALTPTLAAYATGQVLALKVHTASGATPTLNVNTLGAKKLYKSNGTSAPAQIAANELQATTYLFRYDAALDSAAGGFVTDTGGGGGSSTYDPMDFSTVYLQDEFLYHSEALAEYGQLGWSGSYGGAAGTVYEGVGGAGHWGLYTVTTAPNANDEMMLYLNGYNDGMFLTYTDLTATAGWEMRAIVKLSSTANIRPRFGASTGYTGTSGIYLEYNSATDSNWNCVTNNGGTATRTDTTVAASTDWVSLRLWSDVSGTIKCSVNSTATAGQSTNLPATNLNPVFRIQTLTTATKALLLDAFRMKYVTAR